MPASNPPATAPSQPSPPGAPLGAEEDPIWGDESAVFELRGSRPPQFGVLDYAVAPRASVAPLDSLAPLDAGSLPPLDGLSLIPLDGDSLPPLDGDSLAPLGGDSLPPLDSLAPLDGDSFAPLDGDSFAPLDGDSLPPLDGIGSFDSLLPHGSAPPSSGVDAIGDGSAANAAPIEDVGQLFNSYRGYVAKIGRRILGPSSEVDDLIQDVFLATVRDVHKVKDPARLRAWLATVTTRMAKRRRFRSSTHPITCDGLEGLEEVASDPGPGPESTADLSGNIRKLLSLPDELRTPWLLKHVEGHTLEDVAKQCDCSLSTAARRIQTVSLRLQRRR